MSKLAHSHHDTVASVLGAFTLDRIRLVSDIGLRAVLTRTHAMATGLATTLLAGGAEAALIGEVHVTLDDVRGLVADALHLLDEIVDRDAKHAAANAAVAAVNATEHEIAEHLSSLTLLLRGKLGAKAPSLAHYGVLPLSTGGRRHRAAAATTAKPTA